ncbi:MAG TPA: acetoacetate--CoA ligase [Acidimicrobiia bacterium]|nr:acetoacetate--CoA ligase [Acidimicrobiia bacterium]
MSEKLWAPSEDRILASNIDRFRRSVVALTGLDLVDTAALHRWSIEEPARFWSAVWDDVGMIGEKGESSFVPGNHMWEGRFFPEARLNVAENLLDGRGAAVDQPALIYQREDGFRRVLNWAELRQEVAAFASALRAVGVGTGDRVAAWTPHIPETMIAFLAAASVGATFTSTSSDFGVSGVVDRFGQVEPKVLLVADGYHYGGRWFSRLEQIPALRAALPTLKAVVAVSQSGSGLPDGVAPIQEFVDGHQNAVPRFERLPFDHPIYVLYSSGTTGMPKCIVHRAGGVLIKHLQEQRHHCDVKAGDRLFYFTTSGWMMWNWLVSGLGHGAGIVLYDGSPLYPGPDRLFDLVDEVGLTMLGVSAKFIDSLAGAGLRPMGTHDLRSLRVIGSTGSPLSEESFRYVYEAIKQDVHLASISGGTDLCGCFVGGDPTRPVYAGEIQAPALGMAVEVWDEQGKPVAGTAGELVCTAPFPSMPLTFWGPDGDALYRSAYFSQNPGVWTHGDYALTTSHGGFVILGRSDATLNAGGVRIGTAEIYRIVEAVPEVVESVVIGQRWERDTRVVLFVRLAPGFDLTEELENRIRARLRDEGSPRHVPALILAVADIPRTRSGKISELAVGAAVNGDPIRNIDALANPESLDEYRSLTAGPSD